MSAAFFTKDSAPRCHVSGCTETDDLDPHSGRCHEHLRTSVRDYLEALTEALRNEGAVDSDECLFLSTAVEVMSRIRPQELESLLAGRGLHGKPDFRMPERIDVKMAEVKPFDFVGTCRHCGQLAAWLNVDGLHEECRRALQGDLCLDCHRQLGFAKGPLCRDCDGERRADARRDDLP